MKLMEFFSKTNNLQDSEKKGKEVELEELFSFILEHDKLHKDYFFPIAMEIKKLDQCPPELINELYMPMVKKGCKEYYEKKKLTGKLGKLFPEEMREDLCQKLHDHYYEDVKSDKYQLGGW